MPTDDSTRREFIEIATVGLGVGVTGGTHPELTERQLALAQQAIQDLGFSGVALLLGPERARPEPNDEFFSDKPIYHYLYIASDTGGRFVIETGDTAWTDISPVVGSDILTEPVTVVDDATEVFVYNAGIQANELRVDEQHRVRLHGRYSTASTNQTFQLRFYINGSQIGSTTSATGLADDAPVRATFVFTVQEIGTNGQVQPYIEATFNNVNDDSTPTQKTIDTTATVDIRASIEWGTASVDNEVVLDQASHELIS